MCITAIKESVMINIDLRKYGTDKEYREFVNDLLKENGIISKDSAKDMRIIKICPAKGEKDDPD